MEGDIEAAQRRWRDSGPLSSESMKLLLDWREASLTQQPDDLIFTAFVRSLTPEQQSALAELMKLVDRDEAFRWF